MKLRLWGMVVLATGLGFLVAPAVFGQDRVERRDKKGASTVLSGKILEETPSGIKIKLQVGNRDEVVTPGEVARVSYSDLPAKAGIDLQKAAPAEAGRDFATLLKAYEGVQALPELKTSGPATRRYIDYRVVMLRAAVADGEEQMKAAAKSLADFVSAHGESWEYPIVARQLGRLQGDLGEYAAATRTFEGLQKNPAVPAEFKHEAAASLIDLAFQSEDYALGKQRVEAVAKDANAPAALKARVAIYQLGLEAGQSELPAVVKKIEEAIAKASDPSLKALGYNVLGDVYLSKKQRRDAMWSYLWASEVYNQDRGELIKALTRLIKIFEEDRDEDKVKLFKDKLARAR